MIIPNSVSIPSYATAVSHHWRPDGRRRLLYLSRIREKKLIDLLIDAMAQLNPEDELDVFSAGEPDYLECLRGQSKELGLGSRVRFRGNAGDARKAEAFRNADIFVLLRHSKYFRIAVAEALAHGLPVVTTRNTPWADFVLDSCGRSINLGCAHKLRTTTEIGQCALISTGALGREWVIRDLLPDTMNRKMLRLYYELVFASESRQNT